jgi:hypothetical protein
VKTLKTVVVLIPIYTNDLSETEHISLARCLEVLGKHNICTIAPQSLSLPDVVSHLACERFEDKYFTGISGYSSLLLSPHFYKRFKDYDYMLIHQLDVFIFKDSLLQWCEKSFSFIGAPWLESSWWKEKEIRQGLPFWIRSRLFSFLPPLHTQVGNGGLSLRKINHMYFALTILKRTLRAWGGRNEDSFFSIAVPECWWWSTYRIPHADEALGFSIEEQPKLGLSELQDDLPFGCHGWDKHEPETWHPIFKKLGYDFDLEKLKSRSEQWQQNRKNKQFEKNRSDDG